MALWVWAVKFSRKEYEIISSWLDCWTRIHKIVEYYCILSIEIAPGCKNLETILENKVV